jgi:hypothetical protein
VSKILVATVKQESPDTVTIELREQTENRLLGYIEATCIPAGVRLDTWHGLNETQHDEQIILRGERL